MGEKALVESLTLDSIKLIKCLDRSNLDPLFALWYYYEDAGEWRFIIGGERFDQFSPKQEAIAYQKVSETISSCDIQSLSISLIKIVKMDDSLPTAVRFLVDTPPNGFVQVGFSDVTINGIFIKEMLIFRSARKNA